MGGPKKNRVQKMRVNRKGEPLDKQGARRSVALTVQTSNRLPGDFRQIRPIFDK